MAAIDRASLRIAALGATVVLGIASLAAFVAPLFVVPVAVASAVGAVLFFTHRWKAFSTQRAEKLELRVGELSALVALHDPMHPTPLPWSNWALPAVGIGDVLRTIRFCDSRTIVECGCGISSIYIARLIAALGRGHLYCLEEDADWAGLVRRLLRENGLERWATVVCCPLDDREYCGRETRWYTPPIDLLPADATIDLLLVDGPKGRSGPLARLGAVPHFEPQLADKVVIYLDDVSRPDEQEIVRIWSETFDLEPRAVRTVHGMTRFTRRSSGSAVDFAQHRTSRDREVGQARRRAASSLRLSGR